MQGWIKLHRQVTEWEWYKDLKIKSVWLHLLLTTNFEARRAYGFELAAGQQITTVSRLSSETGLTVKEVRRAIKKLEEGGEIAVKTTNKFTIITIVKWAFYQTGEPDGANNGQTTGKQIADIGQTKGKRKERTQEGFKNVYNFPMFPMPKPRTNRFINYTQSEYDFDEIERKERELRKQW